MIKKVTHGNGQNWFGSLFWWGGEGTEVDEKKEKWIKGLSDEPTYPYHWEWGWSSCLPRSDGGVRTATGHRLALLTLVVRGGTDPYN